MAKKYAMVYDENLCIGCQACSIACRSQNNIDDDFYRLQVKIIGPKKLANNKLIFDFHRHSCMHCDDAPCVNVCPTNASYIDDDGIVLVNNDLCVGCGYCIVACPYQARYINPQTNTPDKCTFCKESKDESEDPACVSICPTDALIFGDIVDPFSKISEKISTNITKREKLHLGTEPKMFMVANKKGEIK